jgi:WD40 repeat protein
LWDVATSGEVATLRGHKAGINTLRLSGDGTILVSAGNDRTVKLWNMATKEEVATLTGHSNSITSVAITHDAQTVVSGGWDTVARVWDVPTSKERATLSDFKGHVVWSMALSPDGVLATGNGYVRLWNLTTLQPEGDLCGNTSYIASLTFSPDGNLLAAGTGGINFRDTNCAGVVMLWEKVEIR